jgi:hypothetical protein
MFCSNCGNSVSENAVICLQCGASLANTNQRRHFAPNGIRPKTWLVESILVTLCCVNLLGVIGIIYAIRVESRFNAGDVAGAEDASSKAKLWTIISLCVGVGAWVIVWVNYFFLFGALGSAIMAL